jgi:hypothetical protein
VARDELSDFLDVPSVGVDTYVGVPASIRQPVALHIVNPLRPGTIGTPAPNLCQAGFEVHQSVWMKVPP